MNSGISGLPQLGQMFGNFAFSSIFLTSFLRLVSSVLIFSRYSPSVLMSFTSALTLVTESLTCARVSEFASSVSIMTSMTSLLSSSSCVSTVLCLFASESILLRKVSTGFSKAITHVIPQKIAVAAALIQK